MKASCKRFLNCLFSTVLLLAAPVHAIDLLDLPAIESGAATKAFLLDITRRDDDAFVAAGTFGIIIRSDDAGASWEQAEVPASVTITSVHFPTPESGWAVGHDGLVLHSEDGGRTWQKQLDGHELNEQIIKVAERIVENSRAELEALQADPEADEYDVEDAQFMLEEAEFMLEGAVDDAEAGPVRPLLDVWFIDEQNGVVAGSYGMLLRTSDGGNTWRLESDRMDNPEAFHLNQIREAPDGKLFIAGEAGFVYRSSDGGDSWDNLEPGYEGSYHGLVIVPRDAGAYELIAFGLQGNVFSSSDQGDSWRQVDAGTGVTLFTGAALNDSGVVLAGSGGAIVTRSADQPDFSLSENPDRRIISGLIQCNRGNLILVGLGGVRYTTADGTPMDSADCAR